jgi:integrase/recombinase XerD
MEVRVAMSTGGHDPNDFSEFDDPMVRRFLKRRSKEVTSDTVDGDITVLRQYTDHLAGTPVEEATYENVVGYVDELVDDGATEGTVKAYVSSISQLHSYLNHFHQERMPDVSKIPNRYERYAEGHQRKPIDPEEVEALIGATTCLRDALVIAITYFEGLRASDTADIKIRDVRLEEKRVVINKSKFDKTRRLSLHESLEFMLRLWLEEERPSYPYAPESEYLFVGDESEKIDNQDVWEIVHDAAKEAGLQRIVDERKDDRPVYRVKPHVLRHSFATHAYDDGDGMEIEDLSVFLGHEDTRTTKEYIHEFTEERANDSFDQNFDPF